MAENTVVNDTTLARQVADNLTFQHNWKSVEIFHIPGYNSTSPIYFCHGKPPEKLLPNDTKGPVYDEVVFPTNTKDKISIAVLNHVFKGLNSYFDDEEYPYRVLMAMVTDDSTVVYYIVNEGLEKPRKN